MLQPLSLLNNRKNRRSSLPHFGCIPLHNPQIRPHRLRQINLVNNQQIRPRDTWPALPGHLVPARDVDHVDDEIGQFARVVSSQVVATGLDEEQVGFKLALEGLEGEEVGAYVFADGGVGAATCFDSTDAGGGESFVAG